MLVKPKFLSVSAQVRPLPKGVAFSASLLDRLPRVFDCVSAGFRVTKR